MPSTQRPPTGEHWLEKARLLGENIMELVCVPWTFLVALGGLCLLCAVGWAWTVHHVQARLIAEIRKREEAWNERR